MDNLLQTIQTVLLILSLAGNILTLLYNHFKTKRVLNSYAREIEDMKKNRADQLEEEKEIKDMAMTLCDRCGKQLKVSDATLYGEKDDNFVVCATCAAELETEKNELLQLQASISNLEKQKDELLAKIEALKAKGIK